MYRLTRNIHLLIGVSGAALILVYAISAVQMAHQWKINPRVSEQDIAVEGGLQPRALAQWLMDHKGYRGELTRTFALGARYAITISRPGTSYDVTYDVAGNAHVKRTELPFVGVLNRLHHLNGFEHASLAMNAWAWVLAWISVVLIALGATGLYMWFRFYKERLTGSILLGLNLCLSVVLLILLRS